MEYNELIAKIQHQPVDTPDTNAILAGMRRKMHRSRQRSRQRQALVAAACLLLAIVPLALPIADTTPKPTLAETVSATLPSSPNDLPAPLAGYRNSLRNHQIHTVI